MPSSTRKPSATNGPPPRLARSYSQRNALAGSAFVAFALFMWWIPAVVAYFVIVGTELGWVAKFLIALPLSIVSGQGMHLTGWVGHEGMHFNLFRSRYLSAVVGIVVSSAAVGFLVTGVAIDHFNHHRYTNRPGDPDLEIFSPQQNFWSRMLLTRARANKALFQQVIRLLRGLPLGSDERHLPLTRPAYQKLVILNLLCCAGWVIGYAWVGMIDVTALIVGVLAPLNWAMMDASLRSYLEHNETDEATSTCARSRSHWLWTLLFFGKQLPS
jgi:fatty acid desaturase